MPPTTCLVKTQQAASAAPADLGCLEGVRALGSTLIVVCHSLILWLALPTVHPATAPAVVRQSYGLGRLGSHGQLGVDIFFLLSALLAAYQLIPALQAAGSSGGPALRPQWREVQAYWRRRAWRILPPYALALLLGLATTGRDGDTHNPDLKACYITGCWSGCPRSLWAHALLLNNARAWDVCGIHFWTLATTAQFYLAFPLLLLALRPRVPGFRGRILAAAAASTAACAAYRQAAVRRAGLGLPHQYYHPQADPVLNTNLVSYVLSLHLPSMARVASLAAGASAGCLLSWPAALAGLRRHGAAAAVAAASLQAAWVWLVWRADLLGGSPKEGWHSPRAQLQLAHLRPGGLLSVAMLAASLLCLAAGVTHAYRVAAAALACAPCRFLGGCSYELYLTHPQWQRCALAVLLPGGGLTVLAARAPVGSMWLATALTLGVSVPAAEAQRRVQAALGLGGRRLPGCRAAARAAA